MPIGLRAAIESVLLGATWHRCRVHFRATCSPRSPRAGNAEMVAAATA